MWLLKRSSRGAQQQRCASGERGLKCTTGQQRALKSRVRAAMSSGLEGVAAAAVASANVQRARQTVCSSPVAPTPLQVDAP